MRKVFFLLLLSFFTSLYNFTYAQDAGDLDPTFNPTDMGSVTGMGTNGSVMSIALQPDNKILIAGLFGSYNGTYVNRIVRFYPDGTVDSSFTPESYGFGSNIEDIAVQTDGKIVVGGDFGYFEDEDGDGTGNSKDGVVRLNSDGSPDYYFNYHGSGTYGNVYTVAIQQDSKILVGGPFGNYNHLHPGKAYVARLETNGLLDAGFNPSNVGPDGVVYSIAVQSDGKILIAGAFNTYNGVARNFIARLNADGTLDAGFNSSVGANSMVYSVVVQSNGKILIAGWFDSYNGTTRKLIARLNSDGSLDTTFDPGTGFNGPVWSMVVQPDGKIIAVGDFTTFRGNSRKRIVRINSDGSLDTDFNVGQGANNIIWDLALLPNDKVLVAGSFTSYNNKGKNHVALINTKCVAAISITANSGTSICSGTGVVFNATSSNAGINPTYQWKKNGTNVGISDIVYSVTGLSDGDIITCEMASNNPACTGAITITSNALTMTVSSNIILPSVSIAANTGTNICTGVGVTFKATTYNAGTTPSYQWIRNGYYVGDNNAVYTVTGLLNNDDIYCLITANPSCTTPNTAVSNSLTMKVNPKLFPSVSIISNQTNVICTSTNVVFTALPIYGGTSPDYQWLKNGINVGANKAIYTVTGLTNQDTINCIMTSNADCIVSNIVTSNKLILNANPNLFASVSITSNIGIEICEGSNVVFSAIPINGGTAPIYQWQKNGVNVGKNNSAYTVTGLIDKDSLTCLMVSNALCAVPSTVTSNVLRVTVNTLPNPSIMKNGKELSTQAYNSYQWQLNNADITANAHNSTYLISKSGSYKVKVMDVHGCTGFSPPVEMIINGIDIKEQNTISIHPNPVEDVLMIASEEPLVSVEVFSIAGERLISALGDLQILDIHMLQPSMYFIHLKTISGRVQIKKISKQ